MMPRPFLEVVSPDEARLSFLVERAHLKREVIEVEFAIALICGASLVQAAKDTCPLCKRRLRQRGDGRKK